MDKKFTKVLLDLKIIPYLFLLTLPFSVHSQITFNDIKKIDSEQDFQRVCIENGLQKDHSVTWKMQYAYRPYDDFKLAYIWASYYINDDFRFLFVIDNGYGGWNDEYYTYQKIIADIKNSCNFYKVEDDVAYYSCPGSLYKGKIGFYVEDRNGIIETKDF
ncbi:MAG: hypothetical protein ACPGYF_02640 [Chitinophagales bacterium]